MRKKASTELRWYSRGTIVAKIVTFGAMAQLVARPTPDRKVGSSSLSGLIIFLTFGFRLMTLDRKIQLLFINFNNTNLLITNLNGNGFNLTF